jgi:hypothetical protein
LAAFPDSGDWCRLSAEYLRAVGDVVHGFQASKRAVYDLSATPFFLRGSGYEEGTPNFIVLTH